MFKGVAVSNCLMTGNASGQHSVSCLQISSPTDAHIFSKALSRREFFLMCGSLPTTANSSASISFGERPSQLDHPGELSIANARPVDDVSAQHSQKAWISA
jgi:hypothetical protein